VLQGCKTFILQDADGQIDLTHSVSAGLDYAAVGPEHAFYHKRGRIDFAYATDDEVLAAFQLLSRLEGIIPALESTHAVAFALKRAAELPKDKIVRQPQRPRRQGHGLRAGALGHRRGRVSSSGRRRRRGRPAPPRGLSGAWLVPGSGADTHLTGVHLRLPRPGDG